MRSRGSSKVTAIAIPHGDETNNKTQLFQNLVDQGMTSRRNHLPPTAWYPILGNEVWLEFVVQYRITIVLDMSGVETWVAAVTFHNITR